MLLGETREELGGSEYLAIIHRRKAGAPPRVDLAAEAALQRLMVELARRGWLRSAHDCSEGGLAVAVAECCVMDPEHLIGATIHGSRITVHGSSRPDALLFGESQGRIVISCERRYLASIQAAAAKAGVPARVLGAVGGARLSIYPWIDESLDVINETWRKGLEAHLTN